MNTTHGIFPDNVVLAFDTVPINVNDMPGTYQPKYKRSVMKVLTCCTLTGYTLFVSKPFTGSVTMVAALLCRTDLVTMVAALLCRTDPVTMVAALVTRAAQ
jgi:hypothetical protein